MANVETEHIPHTVHTVGTVETSYVLSAETMVNTILEPAKELPPFRTFYSLRILY